MPLTNLEYSAQEGGTVYLMAYDGKQKILVRIDSEYRQDHFNARPQVWVEQNLATIAAEASAKYDRGEVTLESRFGSTMRCVTITEQTEL